MMNSDSGTAGFRTAGPAVEIDARHTFDLAARGLRELNRTLHGLAQMTNQTAWEIVNTRGSHAIAAGVDAPVDITVRGTTGYYCAGMNKQATIRIEGSAGPGVAENMMSGAVIVAGDASQYAGATGRGGLLVIKGNASSRCGISMKGIDIVVHGNIDHMSAFTAQSGNLVVLGDAGDAPKLPLNMLDALRTYDKDKRLKSMMGAGFSSAFLKLKHREWQSFVSHFPRWEHENTLDV